MLSQIKEFFNDQIVGTEDSQDESEQVRRAAAALLIEVTRSDYADDPRELEAVRNALRITFFLEESQLDELMELADIAARESTSSYDFTRLVNDNFDPNQKLELISAMWQVAFADGRLDKYEEHMIRRVAELIYVPHGEFIRMKHRAEKRASE